MRYFLITAILIATNACQKADNTTNDTNKVPQAIQMLTGVWVKSDYIDDLIETKSPAKSWEKLDDMVTLIIDPEKFSNDTLTVGTSINNHEGGFFHAMFSDGMDQNVMETDIEDYETSSNSLKLGYEINNADTSVLLLRYNANEVVVEKVKFTKVCESQRGNAGADYGIHLIVNRLLFEGTYRFVDTLAQSRTVEFNVDGKIRGLEHHTTYQVQTDFMIEEGNLQDVIWLDNEYYSFRFTDKKLQLFQMTVDKEGHFALGKQKYEFLKQ